MIAPGDAGAREAGIPVAEHESSERRRERELREAQKVVAHLRGVTLDAAAQALEDHAVLTGTSVTDVVREVLAHRPVIRPRRLTYITDLDAWAATGRARPDPSAACDDTPAPNEDLSCEAGPAPPASGGQGPTARA
jgi:hypothetical protein